MNETGNIKNENLCKVCGDKASGKHYGVASCDGCRGFFKRSIRRNLEYVCKENGRCVVDVTRRNQCQACRFKKCLQVNMKRDAVQHERAPRIAQTNLHGYTLHFGGRLRGLHNPNTFPNLHFNLQNPALVETPPLIAGHYLHPNILCPTGLINSNFNKPTMDTLSQLNYVQKSDRSALKDDEVTSSEEITQNKANLTEESHKLLISGTKPFDANLPFFPTENIYETAAKLLFLAIKWARSIPSFLQLSYSDQSLLLEESWSELFVLTASQWIFPIDENNLLGNSTRLRFEDDVRRLKEVITKLTLLRVDHTEYACLKALVLFKSECRGLCEPHHVELLQDQTHVMLNEYCAQKHNVHKGRFGKLLLTLPALQAITKKGLEEVFFRQTVGDVAIERLLNELAKATHTV